MLTDSNYSNCLRLFHWPHVRGLLFDFHTAGCIFWTGRSPVATCRSSGGLSAAPHCYYVQGTRCHDAVVLMWRLHHRIVRACQCGSVSSTLLGFVCQVLEQALNFVFSNHCSWTAAHAVLLSHSGWVFQVAGFVLFPFHTIASGLRLQFWDRLSVGPWSACPVRVGRTISGFLLCCFQYSLTSPYGY